MRLLSLLFAALISPALPAQDEPIPSAVIAPTEWLVIGKLDKGGRRPFRPSTVFAKHLLERNSAPPKAGETLVGEAQSGSWQTYTSEQPGKVETPFRPGWAYTTIEVEQPVVMMARLHHGAYLYVNGAGFVGDYYGYGFKGVPIALAAGVNQIYMGGFRGFPQLTLTPLQHENELVIATWDALIPDLVRGDERGSFLEMPVFNASTDFLNGGAWRAVSSDSDEQSAIAIKTQKGFLPNAAPLAPFALRIPIQTQGEAGLQKSTKLDLALTPQKRAGGQRSTTKNTAGFTIPIVEPGTTRRVVFPSNIDGSLQEYGLVERDPELATEGLEPSLVLSLHGASVPAMNQARAYGRKGDFSIAAPLNRRPFGFDWQDWGRLDGYEALEHALGETGVDNQRVFLTGHSMGGHGTWHFGANDPDRFRAIAPSAGWASFDTYGSRPAGALDPIWRAADATSLTFDLIRNLGQIPIFVLHGDADNNVPVSEAESMIEALLEIGVEVSAHFEAGAGHWWGNQCMDWPGIFDLFTQVAKRPPAVREQISFRTVDPAVDSKHHWIEVLQSTTYGEPIEIDASWDRVKSSITVKTTNAGALVITSPDGGDVAKWHIDDQVFEIAAVSKRIEVTRTPHGTWNIGSPSIGQKSPDFAGPFKRAFTNNFTLIYGTAGDDQEDLEQLERARYDLERWSYRAAAEVELISDKQFLAQRGYPSSRPYFPSIPPALVKPKQDGDNIILYGNSYSNEAWNHVLPSPSNPSRPWGPFDVMPGRISIGETKFEGNNLLLIATYPRVDVPRGSHALVGVFASTGIPGARLGYNLPVFVSGVGLPDWTVISTETLKSGDGGVLGAGWFDKNWGLAEPLYMTK